jgi:deazaflavin-dependent oxidoreductase (nitroreductase family)
MQMSIELTPKGTYGVRWTKAPLPLQKAFFRVFTLLVQLRGIQVLTLTTIGARSGHAHRVDLSYFPEGENAWLIVASKGGSATHPAWYYNLARNPDQVWVNIGKRRLHVQAESLQGGERDEAYRRIAAQVPAYAGYQEKTDRLIPVIRLKPVQQESPV